MSDLIVYDEVRAALEQAESVDELSEAKARIDAATTYARRKQLIPAVLDGLELKLRCERRLGEVFAATVRPGPNPAAGEGLPQGVSYKQSSTWQRLASVDAEDFEHYIAQRREKEEEPTTAGALRLANGSSEKTEKAVCPTCGHKVNPEDFKRGV